MAEADWSLEHVVLLGGSVWGVDAKQEALTLFHLPMKASTMERSKVCQSALMRALMGDIEGSREDATGVGVGDSAHRVAE